MKIQRAKADRMRTAVAVALACLVALSSDCAFARHANKRPGAEVVVQQIGGTKIKGELVGVRLDALVLETRKGAATIPVSDVESVWTVKRMSNDGKTAWVLGGLLGGIALGVGAAKVSNIQAGDMGEAIGLGSVFLFGGIAVGGGVAALMTTRTHKGNVYDFANKPPGEIELMLTDLKKLARVRDYR